MKELRELRDRVERAGEELFDLIQASEPGHASGHAVRALRALGLRCPSCPYGAPSTTVATDGASVTACTECEASWSWSWVDSKWVEVERGVPIHTGSKDEKLYLPGSDDEWVPGFATGGVDRHGVDRSDDRPLQACCRCGFATLGLSKVTGLPLCVVCTPLSICGVESGDS